MAWLAPYTGLDDALDQLLAGPYASAEVLLFTTLYAPQLGDDLAVYEAIEASWTGYARQTAGPWDAAQIGDDDRAFSYSSLLSFDVNADPAGAIVYGYAVVLGSVLLWAELLDSRPVPANGVPVTIKLRVSLGNLPAA